MKKLTQQQKIEIYCIKHGHANYVWKFWGYVHCGRCGTQIGDQLGSFFNTNKMIVVGHDCVTCNGMKKHLSKLDKIILGRLEKNTQIAYDYEKVLDGLII